MATNYRGHYPNTRSSQHNNSFSYQQGQKRKYPRQQHDEDELDNDQGSQRISERFHPNANNSRQQLNRPHDLAHNTGSRRDNIEAALKQSSLDLGQAEDSSELNFELIADTVQGNTEAQMACYQKIAFLFQEGLGRMKALSAMVKTLSPPQNSNDKIQELQNLLEGQGQEKDRKVQELQNLLNEQCQERNIKVKELQDLLNARDQEKEALEKDLVSLKHKVATLSRMPDQVSDAELKEEMDAIWQQVRSWVKTNFRQSKTVPSCIEEMPALSESSLILLGDYWRGIPGTSKAHMLKIGCAVVGRELARILDEFYFGIANDESPGNIFQLVDSSKVDDPDYHQWRARTAGRLNRVQSPNLQNAVNLRLVLICHDLDLLGRELFGVEQDDTRFHHLLEIVEKSVKLGHTCAAQHSRLGFHMPHCKVDQGMLFDPKLMENVSSAEMIETCDMMVKFPVFPCLYKYDCNSDSQDAIIISKAKVYCDEN